MEIIKRKKSNSVIPLSAMGDIAFLLLIFFMVAGIADAERKIQIELPETRVQVEEKNRFFNLYISKNEVGEIKYFYGFEKCTLETKNLLTNYARSRLLDLPPQEMPKFSALIRANKDIPYLYINGALESLKEAGIHNAVLISEKTKK